MFKRVKSTESGVISAGLLVVLIISIAVLAFGAWYIWDKQRSDNAVVNQEVTNDDTGETIEQNKYLVIEEWGVSLTLTEDIEGAYYDFGTDGVAEYVALYDSDFDNLSNSDGTSCGGDNKYQIYAISRIKPEDLDTASQGAGPDYQEFAFSDEYLFGGLGAHQAPPYCVDTSDGYDQKETEILDIANQKEQAFDAAFKALEKSN